MHHDPAPWDDVATALATPPTPTTEQTRDLVDAIPDDARAVMLVYRDPASLDAYVRDLRGEIRQRVRDLYNAQLEQRIDTGGTVTTAALQPEARLVADIIDVLEGIRGALAVGIDEAKSAAAEILAEVEEIRTMGTTSHRFGPVKISNEQATELQVDPEEVVKIVADYLATRHRADIVPLPPESGDPDELVEHYRDGVIDGAAAVLQLASATWKSTALKALDAELQSSGLDIAQALSIRLEQTQQRRPKGNPRTKVER